MTWKNSPLDGLDWIVSDGPTPYPEALAFMERRVAEIAAGTAPEAVWLVEHPPLYTAGTSARAADLVAPGRFPVYEAGRGGQYTYHGPGQRVGYVMIDLKARGGDVRAFVCNLEEWLIRTLARFNVKGERREGRIGIWVDRGPDGRGGRREDKIAALGVRVRRGITFHGVSLNVDCDLSHFAGIVPCGIAEPAFGVTSLADLGILAAMPEVDMALEAAFRETFGADRPLAA
jgi:lipoyl(octanoyl) transferase